MRYEGVWVSELEVRGKGMREEILICKNHCQLFYPAKVIWSLKNELYYLYLYLMVIFALF